VAISIWQPVRLSHELGYGPPDPQPHKLPVAVPPFEHQVGTLSGDNLGFLAVPPDHQIGRTPNVEVGDHASEGYYAFTPVGILIAALGTTVNAALVRSFAHAS
jgi:hypothetical protein